ncbi:MAG: hypothetical protein QM706_18100 [Nitrospira sp.]
MRWPGHVKPNSNFTGLYSAEDWLPTLVAAAGGDAIIRENARSKASPKVTKNSKCISTVTTNSITSPANRQPAHAMNISTFSDDGDLMAFRDDRFKYHYETQLSTGMAVWRMPLTPLRAPIVIDLLSDPYEYSWDASINWDHWFTEHAFLILPATEKVAAYLATYKEFPPRQRPELFDRSDHRKIGTVDIEALTAARWAMQNGPPLFLKRTSTCKASADTRLFLQYSVAFGFANSIRAAEPPVYSLSSQSISAASLEKFDRVMYLDEQPANNNTGETANSEADLAKKLSNPVASLNQRAAAKQF